MAHSNAYVRKGVPSTQFAVDIRCNRLTKFHEAVNNISTRYQTDISFFWWLFDFK